MFGFRNMTQPAIEKLNRVRGWAPRSERIMGKPDHEKKGRKILGNPTENQLR